MENSLKKWLKIYVGEVGFVSIHMRAELLYCSLKVKHNG